MASSSDSRNEQQQGQEQEQGPEQQHSMSPNQAEPHPLRDEDSLNVGRLPVPQPKPGSRLEAARLCYTTLQKMGQSVAVGFIHQARSHDLTVGSPFISTFEQSVVDGILYVGEQDLSGMSEMPRLQWLRNGLKSGEVLAEELVFTDDKSTAARFVLSSGGEWVWQHEVEVSRAQRKLASFVYMTFRDLPGRAAIVPVDMLRKMYTRLHLRIVPAFSPLAFSQDRTAEQFNLLARAIRTNTDYLVPDTGVRFNPRTYIRPPASTEELNEIISPPDVAFRAFERLRLAIESSRSANKYRARLDMISIPTIGDGKLTVDLGTDEHCEWIIELKDGLLTESEEAFFLNWSLLSFKEVKNPQNRSETQKARSTFHPLRYWHQFCAFSKGQTFCLWIPCSVIRPEWFNGETFTAIPKFLESEQQIRRIQIKNNPRWFDEVMDFLVVNGFTKPTRPQSLSDVLTDQDLVRFAAYNTPNKETDSADEIPSSARAEVSKKRVTVERETDCWWKVERFNAEAYGRGSLVCLPLDNFFTFATAAVAFHTWSRQDKAVYEQNGRDIPLELHSGSLAPDDPLLVIKAHRTLATNFVGRGDCPSIVHGLHMDVPPRPCLFLVDCRPYEDRHKPSSHFLIPSECLDFDGILRTIAKRFGFELDDSITSVRDLNTKARDLGVDKNTRTRSMGVNLCDYVFGRNIEEFMVREGSDFWDAAHQFMVDHLREDGIKPVSWYKYVDRKYVKGKWQKRNALTVTQNYLWTFAELQQEILDAVAAGSVRAEGGDDIEGGDEEEDEWENEADVGED